MSTATKSKPKIKIHPLEQTENRTVLARAERLYEENLGDLRNLIGERAKRFSEILSRQDPKEIAEERRGLSDFLSEVESERFL